MPYLSQDVREQMNLGTAPRSPGQLNYCISRLVDDYVRRWGKDYTLLNEVMGVLACVQAEVYRRIAAPYEDEKREENGEVFRCLS